jgi:hypothetical protein
MSSLVESSPSRDALGRVCLLTATVATPVVLTLLLVRRLAGELQPLPAGFLVCVGLAAAALALAWRIAWQRWSSPSVLSARLAVWWPPAVLALLAMGLSIPGSHPLALVLFWAMLIGEEVYAGLARRSPSSQIPIARETSPAPAVMDQLPSGVSQQITRNTADGVETLTAILRVSFAAAQQTEIVHVSFCPPLPDQPTATAEQLAGAGCEVKISAETYGARLEVKRRGSLQTPAEAIIKLTATAKLA